MTECRDIIATSQNRELSFLDQARAVVAKKQDRIFATWYDIQGHPTDEYTFDKLWQEAGVIAYHLRVHWKLEKGQKVVLCYNFGLHFFASFLGCLRAGVIAVLVYPPGPPLKKSLSKMIHVIEDCQPAAILTDSDILKLKVLDGLNPLSASRDLWPANIPYRKTDGLMRYSAGKLPWSRPMKVFDDESIALNDIAFLQYTSGSTGRPKGVIVTHLNLTANVRLLRNGHNHSRNAADLKRDHVGFSWLPEYHDLGLIYASISPFIEGWRMHMCSPITFIQNPLLWIKLVSKHRVRWSVAPNFGYKLVVRKFLEAKARGGGKNPLPGLDLSSVHHFQNAAEPIGLDTRQAFWECFRDYGLREDWFATGYGLAENVVAVSFFHGYKVSRPRPGQDTSRFLAVGRRDTFDASLTIKIVDPSTNREVDDEVTGELWIAGASKAAGYLGKPGLTQDVFQAKLAQDTGSDPSEEPTFLRTGDLAFFQDDCLFVCGRIKDLIIVNGVNYYPHDLEYLGQEASPGVRPGSIAAFSPGESADSNGEVQVVFEIRKECEKDAAEVCATVRDAIAQGLGLTPTMVVAIKERSICKTTSGKIQRRKTRQMLQDGILPIVHKLGQTKPGYETETAIPEDSLENLPLDEKYDRILASILGDCYDQSKTWGENGISSMLVVELTNKLSQNFPVSIPPDFPDRFVTPEALKRFVLGPSTGAFFPVHLDKDLKPQGIMEKPTPRTLCTVLQGVGVTALLLIIAVSTVPAYHFAKLCDNKARAWLKVFLPLTLPVWHLSFSILVVIAKWFVIGRYSTRHVAIPSVYFLRWWFVDRALETWEFFTGQFLLNTPLIWLFYRFMGTNMPTSVKVDAFIREFDLINMEHSVSIEGDIRCRKFGPFERSAKNGNGNPSLRFRPINVAANCTIRGHVGLGASIGEGSCVEKLAAVPEGAQVPAGVVAVGSPAFYGSQASKPHKREEWFYIEGVAKLAWILSVLYVSALYYMIGELAFGDLRQMNWRYASLSYLVLVIAFSACLGFLVCIPLKWLLVGRRRPGKEESEFQKLCHWMADYYYNIYCSLFCLVADNTVMVNLMLRAMGMDIDFKSKVWLFVFTPSKVDLVTVKRSFISLADLDLSVDSKAERVVIKDSSIGHTVVLTGGTTVQYSDIVPFSRVLEDVIGDPKKLDIWEPLSSVSRRLRVDLATLPFALAFAATFIPPYEFFRLQLLGNKLDILSIPVVWLAATLAIHSLTWGLASIMFHRILYLKDFDGRYRSKPWSQTLYSLYMTFMPNYFKYSLVSLVWGSHFGNIFLSALGWQIGGTLWYFGSRFYDAPLIQAHGDTLVDSCVLNGHAVVYGNIEIGVCKVSGVMHPGTFCLANTSMPESDGTDEVGPFHFVLPTPGAPPPV